MHYGKLEKCRWTESEREKVKKCHQANTWLLECPSVRICKIKSSSSICFSPFWTTFDYMKLLQIFSLVYFKTESSQTAFSSSTASSMVPPVVSLPVRPWSGCLPELVPASWELTEFSKQNPPDWDVSVSERILKADWPSCQVSGSRGPIRLSVWMQKSLLEVGFTSDSLSRSDA